MATENCWVSMRCGREPGGARVLELGVCPAATRKECDGFNRGVNAGRICWAVAGTLCDGKVAGKFATKIRTCMNCEFYSKVVKEDGPAIITYLKPPTKQK
jgi:hypothetical protein